MSEVISYSGGTITPVLIDGYDSKRTSGNVVHPIIGNPNPDVTFRPAQLRTGTLRLLFESETAAKDAEDAHATATEAFTLTSDDVATVSMTYVVAGTVGRSLDDDTRDAWIVAVDFQEVAP